jgi:adenylate cyclase
MKDSQFDVEQLWHDWFSTDAFKVEKRLFRVFRFLPHDPRCKICYSPFDGMGGLLMNWIGRKRSSLNPNFCNVCEDFARQHPGGAEVEMSMLFVDVRGSTSLSEQMTAGEFQKLINRFYVGTTHVIAEQDGLVEKLAGDAVAAFWGAGFAGKEYVSKTVRAAQHISQLMQKQNIPVGIGVHAGVAYFGAMGSADGLVDISAIGEEVNTAARLASKAAAGEIILSEAAIARAHIDSSNLESRRLELKGISAPMTVRVMRI